MDHAQALVVINNNYGKINNYSRDNNPHGDSGLSLVQPDFSVMKFQKGDLEGGTWWPNVEYKRFISRAI